MRYVSEYIPPHWQSVTSATPGNPQPIPPNFSKGLSQPFPTLNIDGGVTNNDPFNYVHDFLASLNPPPRMVATLEIRLMRTELSLRSRRSRHRGVQSDIRSRKEFVALFRPTPTLRCHYLPVAVLW
jgi:hypothetical protein